MGGKGFTLLELSIVLVIIGLIVGGITVGSEMMRQSQIQSIGRDYGMYQAAVNAFVLKYNALPGDIRNARDYWPVAGTTTAQPCAAGAGMNGDADGLIESTAPINNGEDARAWQHLNLSGILPGNFTGWILSSGIRVGMEIPESKVQGAGYWLRSTRTQAGGTCAASSSAINGKLGNFLLLSVQENGGNRYPSMAALAPVDALTIDTKYDDGKPNSGKIAGLNGTGTDCDGGTSDYDITQSSAACRLLYWLD
jgi:prepilin-type N-terminal cleavage/methylation domain-containing protein